MKNLGIVLLIVRAKKLLKLMRKEEEKIYCVGNFAWGGI
jgi:hypothetical protein